MTVTKGDIVRSVIDAVRFKKRKRERQQFLFPEFNYQLLSKRRASDLVDALFEIIKGAMEKGDHVLISGFGKFQVKFKWARKGRNPRTGEQIILDSRRVVTFHCSSKLKEKVNRVGGE
jgi:integration host factor subunit alpha